MLNLEPKVLESIGKGINPDKIEDFWDLLKSLKHHDLSTFDHSLRVGNTNYNILSQYTDNDFYLGYILCAGLGHDVGKLDVGVEIINAKPFDENCNKIMHIHPDAGYNRLIDIDEGLALISKGHHIFQGKKSYPSKTPEFDKLPMEEKNIISFFTMITAISDDYDSILYRSNDPTNIQVKLINDREGCEEIIKYMFKKEILKEK